MWIDGKLIYTDQDKFIDNMCDMLKVTTWSRSADGRPTLNSKFISFQKTKNKVKRLYAACFDSDGKFIVGRLAIEGKEKETMKESDDMEKYLELVKESLK